MEISLVSFLEKLFREDVGQLVAYLLFDVVKSVSTLHWFETELLTREENLVGLMAVNRELLAQAGLSTRVDRIVLDMDSSESPVHGAQEGSAYNGHFESGALGEQL